MHRQLRGIWGPQWSVEPGGVRLAAARRLLAELPAFDTSLAMSDQARATLRHLLEPVLRAPQGKPQDVDPQTCPNCGVIESSKRRPYCSDACREEASFIRQFRTGLTDGWVFDPDRQAVLGQTLWHLLGGGRPLRRSLISDNVMMKVVAKAGGLCAGCGGAATTIDHIGTACNRPINLRPCCDKCCRTRSFGDPSVTSLLEFHAKLKVMAERVAAPHSLKICDTAGWDWRAFLKDRHGGS